MKRTVTEVMDPDPLGFLPGTLVDQALPPMLARGLGGAPVHTRSGRLLGYVACRDLAVGTKGDTVAERMTTPALTIHPGATLWEAAERFAEAGVSRLVVANDGVLVGTVSALDVLRSLPDLRVTPPVSFPNYDPEHEVFWSDLIYLDAACVDTAPTSAGIIVLASTEGVRLAAVPDPRHARRIQETLRRPMAPWNSPLEHPASAGALG